MSETSGQVWWREPGQQCVQRLRLNPKGTARFRYAPFQDSDEFPIIEWVGEVEESEMPVTGSLKGLDSGMQRGPSQSAHEAGVDAALKAIESGAFEKVVLSRSEFWQSESSPEELFKMKCEAYPDAFVYLLSHPSCGVWLGATPELLLHAAGDRYTTVSLAGTKQSQGEGWTAKELHEQQLVTDFIEQELRAEDVSDLKVGPVRDYTYGKLCHLQTQISFSSAKSPDEWLRVLHPTPAVGGYPRAEALAFIQARETSPRGYYAGYLGITESAAARFFVNLRCMQCYANGYRLFAGGGIVAGSNPLQEWEETQAKIESIRAELTA